MTRILITGSRDWSDRGTMYQALYDAFNEFGRDRGIILVHGAARGADKMAKDIWNSQGLTDEPHPARWKELGKKAGVVRNQEMVDLGADLVLAFPMPESIGTYHCIGAAEKAGIIVRVFDSYTHDEVE